MSSRNVRADARVEGKRWLLWAILLVAFSACRQDTEAERQAALRIEATQFARLEKTSQTRHAALRQELARLADAGQLPLQLTATRLATSEQGGPGWLRDGQRILDRENMVAGIREAFESSDVSLIKTELRRYFPDGELTIDLGADPAMRRWLSRREGLVADCRRALQRPRAELAIRYSEGLLADLEIVQQVVWAGQLLGCDALLAAASDNIDQAVGDIRLMLKAAQVLADEPLLTARVAAARLRLDALRLVQAIVLSRATGRKDVEKLAESLDRHLAEWTLDERAWIGERALGLHAYEMVRQGHLLSLLSYKELAGRDTPELAKLCRQVEQFIDEDEWFYLTAMRRVIQACQEPYHKRRSLMEELNAELAIGTDPEQKRFVARLLLHQELDWGQRVQAHDRACVEGWAVALNLALGDSVRPATNPLTGERYDWVVQGGMVYVSRVDVADENWPVLAQPLRVPLFGSQPSIAPDDPH
ncbi:MAG: hypothetical protein KatS3mg110_1216 [Pirellulaceae bacterium]|nr:MAG: hypothetical protein KatS3mg110_1216 [Pirellulaceae bacterium]